MHILTISKFDLHLSDLLPQNSILIEDRFLLDLCLFKFVNQKLNIPLNLSQFGNSSPEFFILVNKVLKVDVSEVVT